MNPMFRVCEVGQRREEEFRALTFLHNILPRTDVTS